MGSHQPEMFEKTSSVTYKTFRHITFVANAYFATHSVISVILRSVIRNEQENDCRQGGNIVAATTDASNRKRKRTRSISPRADEVQESCNLGLERKAVSSQKQAKSSRGKRALDKPMAKESTPPLLPKKTCVTPSGQMKQSVKPPVNKNKRMTSEELRDGKRKKKDTSLGREYSADERI